MANRTLRNPRRETHYHTPAVPLPPHIDYDRCISLVADSSLEGIGIMEGDRMLVFLTSDVRSGDLVSFQSKDGCHVRCYYTQPGGGHRVEPRHPDLATHIYKRDEGSPRGVVFRVERAGRIVKNIGMKLRNVTRAMMKDDSEWSEFIRLEDDDVEGEVSR